MRSTELACYIDHTILAANATETKVRQICDEARKHQFFSVCVNSCWASTVSRCLQGTKVATCSVVGFPLGCGTSASKAFETRSAIEAGAKEIDMVINVGRAKMGDWKYVQEDISA